MMDGLADLVGRTIRKPGDFIYREAFQRVKNKGLAIFRAELVQNQIELAHHLLAGINLFRRAHILVADDGFFLRAVVGLVLLKHVLVAAGHVLRARGGFQRDTRHLRIVVREPADSLQSKPLERGFF